jgi:opacity protein-like surface antigen
MKRLFATLVLVLAGATAAQAATVYVPQDTTPFEIQQADLVRLTGQGIAGSTVQAQVQGPANVGDYDVVVLRNGKPLIGTHRKDFIVRPSGTGKVTVTITVTGPQPGSQPQVTKYEFTVK